MALVSGSWPTRARRDEGPWWAERRPLGGGKSRMAATVEVANPEGALVTLGVGSRHLMGRRDRVMVLGGPPVIFRVMKTRVITILDAGCYCNEVPIHAQSCVDRA